MKTKNFKQKILSLLLCVAIILTYFSSIPRPLAEDTKIDLSNALHFIIRHWHTISPTEKDFQVEESNDNHFVIIEGYIVENNGNYKFYVYKNKVLEEIKNGSGSKTDYIESMNQNNGTITLKVNPMKGKDGKNIEHFSGFSVSAGHSTVNTSGEDKITITYNKNVHLAKAHIFYSAENLMVAGSNDKTVFGTTEDTGSKEKDTAYVYTYATSDGTHQIGDVVKDDNGKPVYDSSKLNGKSAVKTKVYSTLEGLHTDRTASINQKYNDGRTFNIDLESWFTNKDIPTVGLILDASGSMAFTSEEPKAININDLKLSDEQKKQLVDKELKNSNTKTISTESEWKKYFLSDTEIDWILDDHNVDDSRLGVSDYTYYIYDGRDATKEYVPIGYWDGTKNEKITTTQNYFTKLNDENSLIGYYSFTKGNYPSTGDLSTNRDWLLNSVTGKYAKKVNQISLTNGGTFVGTDAVTGWPLGGLKMDSNGFNLTQSSSGIILDAVPKGKEFTISYTLNTKENGEYKDTSNNPIAEIMYIGNSTFDSKDTNFLRTYRAANGSKNRYKGSNAVNNSENGFNYNNVFKNATKNYITHVYKDGKLTTYLNGKIEDEQKNRDKNLTLTEKNIIFNGIKDNYNGAEILLDDIYVFDSALDDEQIKELIKTTPVDKEVAIEENEIVGMIDSKFDKTHGWYYVNQGSDYSSIFNEKINTSKTLIGISTSSKDQTIEFTDDVDLPDNHDKSLDDGGTKNKYIPSSESATKFYIDEKGYLRCFFMSGTKEENIGTSYVYVSDDKEYTKAEVLQRALGSFITKLGEESPGSEVSAVRFSTNNMAGDLSKLVLLDWTDDTKESSSMLSLDRGENNGGFLDFTFSENGLRQYNYGLTGGTYTWTGLQSFKDNLSDTVDKDSKNKYIIIFTDGKDNEYDNTSTEENKAIKLADELKAEGYTIYTVLLPGGPVKDDTSNSADDYDLAKEFLMQLSGTSDENEKKDDYFYSTEELKEKDIKGNSVDEVTNIFTNEILSKITDNLDNYSVKDYIDPRFDLVDADNKVWHLNSKGNVLKDGEKYVLSKETSQEITLSNDSDVDKSAQKAKLFYDDSKDMYYLVWENQTIPGCTLDADRLAVWNARITIRAKDDFIGGNAVLTAGHDEKMNYVYSPNDYTASSGTDKAIRVTSDEATKEKEKNEYPSKGFPRVTVNVSPIESKLNDGQTIYMGEELTENSVIQKIATKSKENTSNNKFNIYYWEYLERYAKSGKDSKSLDDLATQIVTNNSSGLNLQYYYLPDSNEDEKHNQTGTDEHKKDNLGNLTYKWDKGSIEYPKGGIVKDTDTRQSSLSVTYNALPINDNLRAINNTSNRKDLTNGLVKEGQENNKIYDWDSEYKPVVGNEITEEKLLDGTYTTNVVSGGIVLQMKLDEKDKEVLKDREITYSADLYREYKDNGDDESKKVKVGTLTAKYNVNNNSTDIVTANIVYEDDYQYFSTYGLPIGVYTLEENENTNSGTSLLTFSDIENIEITEENKNLFNGNDAVTYKAVTEDNKAYLGTAYEFKNTYTNYRYALFQVEVDEVPTGSVSIEKEAIGENADENIEFEFTITLTSPVDNPIETDKITVKENNNETSKINWTKNDTDNSVTGTFNLKHKDKIEIGNIPENTNYTIEETNKHEYNLKAVTLNSEFKEKESNYSDKVTANETDEWLFVNTSPVSLPKSGGIGTTIFYIIGGILLTISTIIFIYTRKKKHC